MGTALAVLGIGLLVHPLIGSGTAGGSPQVWGALAAGVVVLAAFGFHQHRRGARGRSALIEAGLFRCRGFPAALAAAVLFFAVVNGLTMVVVLQLQLGPHTGVLSTGLTLLPWSCAMAVSSWIAGTRLVPRHGSWVMSAGLTAQQLGGTLGIALLGAIFLHTAPTTRRNRPVPC
ncbi:hypothetical protein [Streptomyces decoyicus]|uniref:hypothetical protein n=1 Tax=Streptomyces decoyicus TaxID=249567 RepID=UPI0033A3A94E